MLASHPKMAANQQAAPVSAGVPNSPDELIAMQENAPTKVRPEKPERQRSAKVKQVLELVRQLESFHDEVVVELKDDPDAKHSQMAC